MADTKRNSNIELLKIFAMFMIVLNHMIQTLSSTNPYFCNNDYVLPLNHATLSVHQFLLSNMAYSGVLGNSIFFICSAYYLIDSRRVKPEKIWLLFFENLIMSIGILIVVYLLRNGDIEKDLVFRSLFPNIMSNNWYVTCYLLFYPIHPLLNAAVSSLTKRQHLLFVAVSSVLYMGITFIRSDLLHNTTLITWIIIYFALAYIKIYCKAFMENSKLILIVLSGTIIGHLILMLVTNYLGIHYVFFEDKLLHWQKSNNPFIVGTAICLVMLATQKSFFSKMINQLSSLSLLVYIFHENILLRRYYRPLIFIWIHNVLSYEKIILWVLLATALVAIFSLVFSFVFDITVGKNLKHLLQTYLKPYDRD